jgi:molybdopterin converting factor small subunit
VATVTLRFFAAARAAAGASERVVTLDDPATIAAALERVGSGHPPLERAGFDRAEFDSVIARCSFLLNEVATTDRAQTLRDGDVLDILPPFAGG